MVNWRLLEATLIQVESLSKIWWCISKYMFFGLRNLILITKFKSGYLEAVGGRPDPGIESWHKKLMMHIKLYVMCAQKFNSDIKIKIWLLGRCWKTHWSRYRVLTSKSDNAYYSIDFWAQKFNSDIRIEFMSQKYLYFDMHYNF